MGAYSTYGNGIFEIIHFVLFFGARLDFINDLVLLCARQSPTLRLVYTTLKIVLSYWVLKNRRKYFALKNQT